MRKIITLLVISAITFLTSIIMFIASFMLNVGLPQSGIMASSLYPQLRTIYILRFGFVCFLLFSIALAILSAVAIKKKCEIKKVILIPLIAVFLISVIGSTVSVFSNYSSNSISGYDVLNNEEYSVAFPYYENMEDNSYDGVYTLIEKAEIYSSKYIGAQSSYDTKENPVLYDIDYFESDNDILLGQFIGQNTPYDSDLIDEGSNKDCLYQIYSNKYSYSIVISNDNTFFVMCLSDFDNINDMDIDTLIKDAYSVFDALKHDVI